ncbi:MAG: helix-turn-helix transcriptional regulator [Erysipelotrichales bacterium]|nr:helix-turn-helix transcriptional regulator [Erysipelotrichales bacterium]
MEFKDKLRKLRLEAGLSQEALADNVHISRSAIAKYENGNGNPSEETLKALAFYFGVEESKLKSDVVIKSENNKRKKIKWTLIACGLFFMVGIITVSTIGIVNSIENGTKNSETNKLEFSSERWKMANNPYERYQMLDSLASKYDLRGYTTDKLTDLLGKPDEIEKIAFDTYPPQNGGCIYDYFIDSHMYSGVRESLSIKISANSKVLSCYYECGNRKSYSIY